VTTMMDSDLLKELIDTLADSRVVLDAAISRVPDNDCALKDTMVRTIKDIDLIRLKALTQALDNEPS
jgi:hypothetical protein